MSTNEVIARRYYPSLSEIVSVDDLPEFLDFAGEGVETLLRKIYYKNLIYSRSQRGDAAFYSLDIIAKNIGLKLPFGMRFVLNPDESGDPTISSFPLSLSYKWEMLAFLRSFQVQQFSFTPEAFYFLGLQVFRISDRDVLAHILDRFVQGDNPQSKFQELIDDINGLYPEANLSIPEGTEASVELVLRLINENPHIPQVASALLFGIYILDSDIERTKERLQRFYKYIAPEGIEAYLRQLITPRIRATLTLSAGIEFPPNILQPVSVEGVPIPDQRTVFKFAEATFYADTEAGIGSEIDISGSLIPQYSQIGSTGFIIEFTKAKLDLSRKQNISEADAAGYAPDFVGLYIKQASIQYQGLGEEQEGKPSVKLVAQNLLIGTGGMTGNIGLETEGILYRRFGNFAVELNVFSVGFKRGRISESQISGRLTIGGFKEGDNPAVIDIEAQIKENGDFEVAAKPQSGLYSFTLPKVLQLHIRNLKLGKEERGFYIEVSGKLDFIADIPGLGKVLPQQIEIERFRIWDNGDLEFEGGSFVIPKVFRLKVGPVNLEVSQISFGAHTRVLDGVERRYRYFGFDGMINTGRAGVSATGNGIKYYFTVDHNETDRPFDSFTSIDAIGIDLTIPGNVSKEKAAFILNGYLSMTNPNPGISESKAAIEYAGSVNFSIPKLRLSGSAAMRLNPTVPAFVVDIGMELPGPIPLGPTGLGIYGFRGLIGQHYLPAKSATAPPLGESATWWEYYKAKSKITGREGVEIDKMISKSGYSVGAGVSIATAFDKGFTFSSKLFLLLGLPDVFLLQGQSGILRSRIGLTKDVDPPFHALIAIDNRSFMTNLGVNYRLPEGGTFDASILNIRGTMELAFFFNNSSGWYLNLGKDQPEQARIQARILTLFQGYAFMMISSKGFKVGGGARFDFNKKFGPVKVGLGAFLDIYSSVSFRPIQLGGRIQFGGYAYLKIFFVRLGLSVMITLAAEAPHPFSIYGALTIQLKLPWPIKRIRFTISVGWTFNKNSAPLREPIEILKLPNESEGYRPAAAINMLSGEAFPINYVNQVFVGDQIRIPAPGASGWYVNFNTPEASKTVTIPMDSFIDIDLLKSVKPGSNRIGGTENQLPNGYTELLPPHKGISNQVTHELRLTGFDVYCWNPQNGGSWQPYNIYEAVSAIVKENQGEVDLKMLKDGYWQFDEPQKYNKIRLLSQHMFSYASDQVAISSDFSALNFDRKDIFCYETVVRPIYVDWKREPKATLYVAGNTYHNNGLDFFFNGIDGQVRLMGTPAEQVLCFDNHGGQLEVLLSESLGYVQLDFGSNDHILNISYYYYKYTVTLLGKRRKQTVLVKTEQVFSMEDSQQIVYDNLARPVDRIVIRVLSPSISTFQGDLILGKYFKLEVNQNGQSSSRHIADAQKTLDHLVIYNRSLGSLEIQEEQDIIQEGAIGYWPLSDRFDKIGSNHAMAEGALHQSPAYWTREIDGVMSLHAAHSFISNADGLRIPYTPELAIEEGDFSVSVTVQFNPSERGIRSVLSKVYLDPVAGRRKGFTLHLSNQELFYQGGESKSKTDGEYTVIFTAYNGEGRTTILATEAYMINLGTGMFSSKQYVRITVSVDRANNELHLYINKRLKVSSPIPEELQPSEKRSFTTALKQIGYLTEEMQRRVTENEPTIEGFIEENQLLDNSLNRTIQPVWRPDTTYAFVVRTLDVIDGKQNNGAQRSFIYGFKTAGPLGHFQEQSPVYQELVKADRAAEFKLANLKHYIDYERSFPDAQGRFNLSKPVFCHEPQVNLLFTKPYLNAMFADWDSYQGLPAVHNRLDIRLLDPYGNSLQPGLIWENLPDITIDDTNYGMLPKDLQIIYLLNKSAMEDDCNTRPVILKKRGKQGAFQFPDLLPNRLYTAVFEAIYQPLGQQERRSEVHRYSFITSRFSSFAEQAGSFVRFIDSERPVYAIYPRYVELDQETIEGKLKQIWTDEYVGNEIEVTRYAVKYERLLYGGIKIGTLEPFDYTVIEPIINIDPVNKSKRILGLIIRCPEPFNEPRLTEEDREETVRLQKKGSKGKASESTYSAVYSRDTSAVWISNNDLNMDEGAYLLTMKYKMFDGKDFNSLYESYTSPVFKIEKG